MVARKLFIDHLAIYLHTELGRAKLDQWHHSIRRSYTKPSVFCPLNWMYPYLRPEWLNLSKCGNPLSQTLLNISVNTKVVQVYVCIVDTYS